jgi:hypothetical protein
VQLAIVISAVPNNLVYAPQTQLCGCGEKLCLTCVLNQIEKILVNTQDFADSDNEDIYDQEESSEAIEEIIGSLPEEWMKDEVYQGVYEIPRMQDESR